MDLPPALLKLLADEFERRQRVQFKQLYPEFLDGFLQDHPDIKHQWQVFLDEQWAFWLEEAHFSEFEAFVAEMTTPGPDAPVLKVAQP